ncbi:galactarate dehydratase [Cohaesibacter celericrescens]|uniref:Galactarate dehydratase n=1 Tax=Cohaesibacter celericrescens TaxID=2067669 RepID=A0A2N5XTM7_9HYPH|nr:galactarate dehydratase [Cohaesibacter celericrescens]PLW77807.1 galactarate dehydratase [Cohaesibacter celericrescens]
MSNPSLNVPSLKVHADDNVSIILSAGGVAAGTRLDTGTVLRDDIPFGHKVALVDIGPGEAVIRYGVPIGIAKATLPEGSWVNEHMIELPEAPSLASLKSPDVPPRPLPPLDGYTFEGYRNADGSVGTRNILGISISVQCVAGVVEHVVQRIRSELLPIYPNVDDVIALTHSYGCGVAINAPDAIIPIRTIKNIALNPNFGGEVMVVGLGCEKLRPEMIMTPGDQSASKMFLQDENLTGFAAMTDDILQQARSHLDRLNQRRRQTCSASELVVGMQCGGSDAFSGITANPVLGFASDLIVRAGGSVMFSEVTEVRDSVHLLPNRAANPQVVQDLIREMRWYDDYLARGGADRAANTTPGNKMGGLSGIVEKSLGSVAKSGSGPISDVIGPGERLKRKGLTFAATPAGDFVCGTLQLAAGMNIHIFTTGRGTPYNLPTTPTIKVATNSALATRWFDLMDVDTGRVATGEITVEEGGWELFHFILDVASGRTETAADKLGIKNDLVLFNPAPIT